EYTMVSADQVTVGSQVAVMLATNQKLPRCQRDQGTGLRAGQHSQLVFGHSRPSLINGGARLLRESFEVVPRKVSLRDCSFRGCQGILGMNGKTCEMSSCDAVEKKINLRNESQR